MSGGDTKEIEAKIIDGEAPVRFVRLVVDGEEQAMIPWDEAVEIYNALEHYTRDTGQPD